MGQRVQAGKRCRSTRTLTSSGSGSQPCSSSGTSFLVAGLMPEGRPPLGMTLDLLHVLIFDWR